MDDYATVHSEFKRELNKCIFDSSNNEDRPGIMGELASEITCLTRQFWESPAPRLVRCRETIQKLSDEGPSRENERGRFLFLVYGDFEFQVTQEAMKFFEERSIETNAIIYDGMLLLSNDIDDATARCFPSLGPC